MRINKFIALSTGLARRTADQVIAVGRVTINGEPATTGMQVTDEDCVALDGKQLMAIQSYHYVLLHKPVGYITSRTKQGTDPTVYALLPDSFATLKPVGRLDRESSGLLLLSDDGDFIHRLSHPSHDKSKVYDLTLTRAITAADLGRLTRGVELEDGISRLTVESARGNTLRVSLGEGRNRQIRRTLGALGYTITKLHRIQVADFKLGQLPSGKWRTVTPEKNVHA